EYILKAVDAFRRRFVVVSPDFNILAANSPLHERKGGEIIGKRCHEFFYSLSSPCDNCAVEEVLKTGKPVLRPKPEDLLVLDVPCYYAYPILDGTEIEAIVSLDFDLPTSTELNKKYHRSNALLRNLILSAVDGVIAADKKGRILIFNQAASEVFGYQEEEALNDLDIRDIYPDDGALKVMRKMRSEAYGKKGKLRSCQVDVQTKGGEIIPIRLNAAIIYEDDREVGTIGFFHDMREELKMKKELEKTQIQLLQSEKMASLGKLAAGVAHQLNNPLGGITLFTKIVMEEYDLEDGVKEDLKRILEDAERCRDTVKELLEFARQTKRLMRPHDVNGAISRTLFLLENQTLFQNIEIRKSLDASLPLVLADIQQLGHLFMNIILNAAQAMKGKGKLEINTRLNENGDRIGVEISDTGPGIPLEILPRIFEPFYTTKEEGEGTGLGLSLVYSIVENHGGDVKAISDPGEGTTFIIEFPLAKEENGGEDSGD
ncbi:MAG: PAS domain-containing protein, partial [Desulfobacterales bacterium]|nr:PAS domain-containing protein [Desulfobacterales bacterium]